MAKIKYDLFSGTFAVREQARSVFKLIRKSGPITRPMLLERQAMPATTLSRVLDRLTADGLITESGQADSNGGRPAILFSVNANARQVIGITVRGARCHLVLMNLLGQVIERSEINPAVDPDVDEWLESLAKAVAELSGKAPVGPAGVAGVGLILPDSLKQSIGLALVDRIGARLGRPAAIADEYSGLTAVNRALQAGSDPETVLLIGDTIRLALPESFLRSGTVSDRPSIEGLLLCDPLAENPGELVTLETLVTCPAVGQRFAVMRDQSSLGFPDFLAALRIGKKKALRLLDATAEALAQALINIACVTGMCQCQLTGVLIDSWPAIVDLVNDKVSRMGARSGTLLRVNRLVPAEWDLAAGAAAWMLSQRLDRPAHDRGAGTDLPSDRFRQPDDSDVDLAGPAG